MKRFINKLRYIKIRDILSLFLLIPAIPCAWYLKRKRPHIWLICENGSEARDNGYWLYRYLCMERPETDVVFVLDRHSPDYKKVSRFHREIIQPAGLVHWIYYLAAEYNISSQKDGKPNAAVCYLFEVFGLWRNKRIFLQHGITHNDVEFLHFANTRMSLFVCGAEPEYQYVKRYFGYPPDSVRYLGFPRFDGLQSFDRKKIILIMPSWRKNIATPGNFSKRLDTPDTFIQTKYYKAWEAFFNDPELDSFLGKAGYQIFFYPHRNMQRFLPLFQSTGRHIQFADWKHYDVQELLKEAAFLITDYSSIAMYFAYMYKPLLYYQFDEEDFRKYQYAKGYFDYERDGFGPVCRTYQEVKAAMKTYAASDFRNAEPYMGRAKAFFSLHDGENCKRNYDAICKV